MLLLFERHDSLGRAFVIMRLQVLQSWEQQLLQGANTESVPKSPLRRQKRNRKSGISSEAKWAPSWQLATTHLRNAVGSW